MHPSHVKRAALELIAAGHNDFDVSRRLGIPRRTIADWRRPTYESRREYAPEICPRCWRTTRPIRFTGGDYAEFLALYLGDGCISCGPRTQRLRLTLDTKYPGIIAAASRLVSRCFPKNGVGRVGSGVGNWVNVSVYSRHLTCVLPQHGPGKKHERPIKLEPWQQAIVAEYPREFLRWLINTDGCRFINRTGKYSYPSYQFANRSSDLVELFVETCAVVSVATRVNQNKRTGLWNVRINRRSSVALMDEHIGQKT